MVLLVNALNEHVVGKNFTAKLELPDFIPEGDHFVFKLGDPNGKSSARLVNSGRAKLRYTLAEISDPSLYLWPDDTPKELPGERTDRVTMALGYAAKDTEYRFVVRSDVAPDQSVVVRVSDVEAMRAKRAQLIDTAMHALNAHLEKPENYAALAKLGQTDPEAGEVAVKVVQEAIASTSPGLPGIAQWMLAADVLEASNWPQLAAKALRRAEALSPSVARSPGGQQLAGIIASHSGEVRVFANADTPKIEPMKDRPALYLFDSKQVRNSALLATKLQTIPALKVYGLSLKGDVLQVRGDKEAARNAYMGAAAIQQTPSIATRIKALDSTGSSIKGDKSVIAASRMPAMSTAVLKANEPDLIEKTTTRPVQKP